MYKCKYFKLQELVHPDLLKEIPEKTLWMMFDPRLLKLADKFRELYGPVFINQSSLNLVNCGLRPIDSSVGAKYSSHKYGRALDLHIASIENKGLTKEKKVEEYNKIRTEYLANEKNLEGTDLELSECLSFEDNISWLHIDTYNRPNRRFNP